MRKEISLGQIGKCGGGVFQVELKGTTLEDYESYLATLENSGFTKYVDNGPDGLDKSVWNTIYIKDELVMTVMHIAKRNRTYISAGRDTPLSKHLFYQDKYVAGNRKNAKTTLHMSELHTYGDSFIIQLKNGNYILDDGGMPADVLYLLDYLEELTPEGQKPIIEGWFISHGHGDHLGRCV